MRNSSESDENKLFTNTQLNRFTSACVLNSVNVAFLTSALCFCPDHLVLRDSRARFLWRYAVVVSAMEA